MAQVDRQVGVGETLKSETSVFTKTESPAYAPASSAKVFPYFWIAAQRRLSLDQPAKLVASRRKVRSREPLTTDQMLQGAGFAAFMVQSASVNAQRPRNEYE